MKESFQNCYQCNSLDNSNCATLRGKLPEVMTCHEYLDTCKVYVRPNMTTHRSCSADDSTICSPQSVNCKQCEENLCNGEIFPSTRLKCHHCHGFDTNSECYRSLTAISNTSYPCETYNFRDSCYLYVDDKKLAYRGCLSDQNNMTEECQADTKNCRICQSSNCNSDTIKRDPVLECMDCDTTNGLECLWGLSNSHSKPCRTSVFFYETESCFTLSSTELGFAIRGCTLDTNVCSRAKCEVCYGDHCNRFSIFEQNCYNCSSENDKNCRMAPFHTQSISCSNEVDYDRRGCFTWKFMNETIRRGCFSDLSLTERLSCLQHNEECEHCVDDENCNKIAINDALSSTLFFNIYFLLLLMILIVVSCHNIIY